MKSAFSPKTEKYEILRRVEISPGLNKEWRRYDDEIFTYKFTDDGTNKVGVIENKLEGAELKLPIDENTVDIDLRTEIVVKALELEDIPLIGSEYGKFWVEYTRFLGEISGDRNELYFENDKMEKNIHLKIHERNKLIEKIGELRKAGKWKEHDDIDDSALYDTNHKDYISPAEWGKLYALYTAKLRFENNSEQRGVVEGQINVLRNLTRNLIFYKITHFDNINIGVYGRIQQISQSLCNVVGEKIDEGKIELPGDNTRTGKLFKELEEIEKKWKEHDRLMIIRENIGKIINPKRV